MLRLGPKPEKRPWRVKRSSGTSASPDRTWIILFSAYSPSKAPSTTPRRIGCKCSWTRDYQSVKGIFWILCSTTRAAHRVSRSRKEVPWAGLRWGTWSTSSKSCPSNRIQNQRNRHSGYTQPYPPDWPWILYRRLLHWSHQRTKSCQSQWSSGRLRERSQASQRRQEGSVIWSEDCWGTPKSWSAYLEWKSWRPRCPLTKSLSRVWSTLARGEVSQSTRRQASF